MFQVHFEKSRNISGSDVAPFEAKLSSTPDGGLVWSCEALQESNFDKVVKLYKQGVRQKAISDHLSIDKGTVSKYVKRAKQIGLIEEQTFEVAGCSSSVVATGNF